MTVSTKLSELDTGTVACNGIDNRVLSGPCSVYKQSMYLIIHQIKEIRVKCTNIGLKWNSQYTEVKIGFRIQETSNGFIWLEWVTILVCSDLQQSTQICIGNWDFIVVEEIIYDILCCRVRCYWNACE